MNCPKIDEYNDTEDYVHEDGVEFSRELPIEDGLVMLCIISLQNE
jgi:hypothetical protein